ncbi:Hypothetical predicted protein [Podarcis lilfordi]|uniref:Uncharacterized protein n=1 Tax=Podarcis lilfordi TaxID=74358 RepID=A0AA35PJ51_9SAUR|nr:Hypothetical predicted protein [Podarcis lilfordi]
MDAASSQENTMQTLDQWGLVGGSSSLPVETNPPQALSPGAESASWFSEDPDSEGELVDASELSTVRRGRRESCIAERARGTPVTQPPSPREEVDASTRPRGNYLVYTEPKEMDFSEGYDVEWMRDPVNGGFRCREKHPKMGQSILMGPRVSRMAYDYKDLPHQLQEVTVGDCRREAGAPDVRRMERQRSLSPGRVYSPVRAQEVYVPVRRYVAEEEEEFFQRPKRGFATAAEPVRPDGPALQNPAPRYELVPVRGGNHRQQSPPGLSLSTLNWRVFPKYQPPTDVLSYLTLFEVTCKDMGVAPTMYMAVLRP